MSGKNSRPAHPLRLLVALGLVGAGCGSTGSPHAPTTTTSAAIPPAAAATPGVGAFDTSFSVMSRLQGVTRAGHGLVGVILPDTTSPGRDMESDASDLAEAFQTAGYSSGQYRVDNARGVEAAELALAQTDISLGATVLVFDAMNDTVGAQAQRLAAANGVKFVSYDGATYTGTDTYYVGFDDYKVGQLIGEGFEACASSWNVNSPQVFEVSGGEDTDPHAVSLAEGYNTVLWGRESTPLSGPLTDTRGYSLIGETIAPGWGPSTGATIFAQRYRLHPEIDATVEADDALANAVIGVLKNAGVGPETVPTTGQGATLQGMQNILQGYQCGSVYKAVYREAQDAVALATYLRAGRTPPATLVNSVVSPPGNVPGSTQPASLLTPVWVDAGNMASTVIRDKVVSAADLCSAVGAGVCTGAGITP